MHVCAVATEEGCIVRSKMSAGRISALSLFICVILRAASRISSVAYATAATDILYMDGVLPDVLYILRQVFLAMSVGVAVTGVILAAHSPAKRLRIGITWAFCLIAFADAASALLLDVCSGAISGGTAVLALLLNTAAFLVEWGFIWLSYLVAHKAKYARNPAWVLRILAAVHLTGHLLMEASYTVQYLLDYSFRLSSDQISGILFTYLDLIAVQGVLVWLTARLLLLWLGNKKEYLSIKGASHR